VQNLEQQWTAVPTPRDVPDPQTLPDEQAGTAEQELLTAERHAALREAFEDLPPCCQRLIALLAADPPVPYAQISARLGIRSAASARTAAAAWRSYAATRPSPP
jgi:DNA-directed RNA polymerase specialized sigma24 family protein